MKSKIYAYLTLFLMFVCVLSCKDEDEPQPQPASTFTADKTTVKVGEDILFTNNSQNATAFIWSFGDGTTSKVFSPTKAYTTSGTFQVSLVSSGEGGSTISNTTITVAPLASFTAEDESNLVALTPIQFTNASKGATSYLWSFGNEAGSTSTEQNPKFTYLKSGTFTVTLKATGATGSTTIEKQITVNPAPPEIYFSVYADYVINKISLDGSGQVTTFLNITDKGGPGLVYDDVHGKIYFTDFDLRNEGKIWRVNLDGTELESVVTGLVEPYAIALDVAEGKMYWADDVDDTNNIGHIWRANLDGSDQEDLVSLENGGFRGLALDLKNRKMYYSAQYDRNIYVADMNGDNASVIVPGAYGFAIAVDSKHDKIYFEDYMQDIFQMADLDGNNIVTVDDEATRIYGIAIDSETDKLFWTARDSEAIYTSNMDGSNRVTVKDNVSDVRGIFLRK